MYGEFPIESAQCFCHCLPGLNGLWLTLSPFFFKTDPYCLILLNIVSMPFLIEDCWIREQELLPGHAILTQREVLGLLLPCL